MNRILSFGVLFVAWIVLSGAFDLFHLGLGVLSAAVVTFLSSDLLMADRERRLWSRIVEAYRFMGYLCWLLVQIVLANLHVLRLALTPAGIRDVDPEVIRFKCGLRSEFSRYILANSITLTPGTVTIRVDGDEFWVHAISKVSARSLSGEMEARIARVFERD